MHRIAGWTMLLVVGLAWRASAAVAADAEAAARSQAAAFAAAWGRHDAKAMAAFFAEDGTLINPGGRLAVGRGEVERLFADEQSTFMAKTTLDVRVARVDRVTGDVVLVLWDALLHGAIGPDGKASDVNHQVTVVERRTADGWEVVAARPVVYLPPPPVASP